jgi:hypothetical protein
MDEFGIRPLRLTPRGWIELVRKDGNRDGDVFGIEIAELVFSIETSRGNRRVRQPETVQPN